MSGRKYEKLEKNQRLKEELDVKSTVVPVEIGAVTLRLAEWLSRFSVQETLSPGRNS